MSAPKRLPVGRACVKRDTTNRGYCVWEWQADPRYDDGGHYVNLDD
jgi:hypothetical protein